MKTCVNGLGRCAIVLALAFLALRGIVAARAGGANVAASATRVTFWRALAMAITAGVGARFGAAVCVAAERNPGSAL